MDYIDPKNPQIQEAISQAVQYLPSFPEVTKIILFGSAAKGKMLDFRSDLDFAVEGLPADKHYGCIGHLLTIMPLPIDLVRIEEIGPTLKQQAFEHGLCLYKTTP